MSEPAINSINSIFNSACGARLELSESFFSTAKDLLLATENIKRLEQKIDTIARDLSSMERRLVRIEIYTEMARPQSASRTLDVPKPRKPSTKKS